jgi:ELWxxDGT repeat protein
MIIFSKNGKELWRSDGTTNGTQKIENFDTNIKDFIQVKNNVYFRANDGIHGYELYKSDGTKEGTLMIKDINPIDDESGFLNILTKVDDTIYFVGNDGIHGNELYKSDGTSEGTMMVKDINIGEASTDFSNAIYIDETIYFTAYANNQYKLYKSNGTNEGTIAIKDIRAGRLIKSKNMFYFNGDDKIYGEELYKSDGTTEGTVMVKDIFKGERGSNPSIICEIDGKILFINEFDDGKPIDIWISDGTKDGTKILKHLVNN